MEILPGLIGAVLYFLPTLCARKHLGATRWADKEQARMRILLSAFAHDQEHFEEIDRREVRWLCEKLSLQPGA